MTFDHGQFSAVLDVFEEGIPEGGGSYKESSVIPGLRLSPEWYLQKFGIRGLEAVRGCVVIEQAGEIGGGQVMEGFVKKKKSPSLNVVLSISLHVTQMIYPDIIYSLFHEG